MRLPKSDHVQLSGRARALPSCSHLHSFRVCGANGSSQVRRIRRESSASNDGRPLVLASLVFLVGTAFSGHQGANREFDLLAVRLPLLTGDCFCLPPTLILTICRLPMQLPGLSASTHKSGFQQGNAKPRPRGRCRLQVRRSRLKARSSRVPALVKASHLHKRQGVGVMISCLIWTWKAGASLSEGLGSTTTQ
jgi:hypothetical protein